MEPAPGGEGDRAALREGLLSKIHPALTTPERTPRAAPTTSPGLLYVEEPVSSPFQFRCRQKRDSKRGASLGKDKIRTKTCCQKNQSASTIPIVPCAPLQQQRLDCCRLRSRFLRCSYSVGGGRGMEGGGRHVACGGVACDRSHPALSRRA